MSNKPQPDWEEEQLDLPLDKRFRLAEQHTIPPEENEDPQDNPTVLRQLIRLLNGSQ